MNEQNLARPAQKLNIKKDQVGSPKLDQQIITGILTSRIETRNIIHSLGQVFYYGFFKLTDQETEIPVIFKTKPDLKKGQLAELKGKWANSNGSRPSFTCHEWNIPPLIDCFYNRNFSPCPFTTTASQSMEKHYRKAHYQKEVIRG